MCLGVRNVHVRLCLCMHACVAVVVVAVAVEVELKASKVIALSVRHALLPNTPSVFPGE